MHSTHRYVTMYISVLNACRDYMPSKQTETSSLFWWSSWLFLVMLVGMFWNRPSSCRRRATQADRPIASPTYCACVDPLYNQFHATQCAARAYSHYFVWDRHSSGAEPICFYHIHALWTRFEMFLSYLKVFLLFGPPRILIREGNWFFLLAELV